MQVRQQREGFQSLLRPSALRGCVTHLPHRTSVTSHPFFRPNPLRCRRRHFHLGRPVRVDAWCRLSVAEKHGTKLLTSCVM